MEDLVLNLYLGAFVFVAGVIVFLLITKKVIRSKYLIVLLDLVHLLISAVLSLAIWYHWPFDFDFMYGVVSFPALFAETAVMTIVYLTIMIAKVRRDYHQD